VAAQLSEDGPNGDVLIDYQSRQPIEDSVRQVLRFIPKDEPIALVGHSLGGVIAALIALRGYANVSKLVTISAPLGGSRFAAFARWVASGIPLLNDITTSSPAILELQNRKIVPPVLSIISTGGSLPTSNEPNDSVVSVSSQRALSYAKKVEINANHFEILLHERTIDQLRKFLHG
jgi:pimeloyl-ACP methyl ester carboxylesterase